MPQFSVTSLQRLAKAHPDIQRVMRAAILDFDFSILESYRGPEDQLKAYQQGNSRATFGHSPHNFQPSLAVDCAPYPIDWKNIRAFQAMAQVINANALKLRVPLVWGGNWRMKDYPHFELLNWRAIAGAHAEAAA